MLHPRSAALTVFLLALTILAGCSTTRTHAPGTSQASQAGPPGYTPPSKFTQIPDAVPQIEHYRTGTSKPYVVLGKRYVPVKPNEPFTQRGLASWYGKKFNGKKTASGEPFNMYAMTAAHPTLPIPSFARVTRVSTGKSIIVKINDRGPFHSKRIIDLSYAAAAKLGLIHNGKGQVIVQAITNDDVRNGDYLADSGTQANSGSSGNTGKPAPSPEKEPAANHTKPVPSLTVKTVAGTGKTVAGTGAAAKPGTNESGAAAQPAPATQPENPAESPAAGSVYLQFGAFSGKHNAEGLAQKLNQQLGQADEGTIHVVPGGNLYRVQAGPFRNRTTAVNAAWRIKRKTGVASTITTRHVADN
jgi:rare lipoprotein A